ncbi:MAG: transglutaminase-like domain-containing protein [Methanobacteriaceae archaeon]
MLILLICAVLSINGIYANESNIAYTNEALNKNNSSLLVVIESEIHEINKINKISNITNLNISSSKLNNTNISNSDISIIEKDGYRIEKKYKKVSLSQKTIMDSASTLKTYTEKNGKLPNYITIEGEKFSIPEILYLYSKTVTKQYSKKYSSVKIIHSVKNPTNPHGTSLNKNISKKEINTIATNTANYISKNKIAPNYAINSFGKIQYQTLVYGFAKVLTVIKTKKTFPNYVNWNVKSTHSMNKYLPIYPQITNVNKISYNSSESIEEIIKLSIDSRINSPYKGESLVAYLKAATNCQSNDTAIINLAKNITAKSKTNKEKAVAIFNWVRDNIKYDYYYNTRKGAKGTLSSRIGNCVDQTHLLIALCRSVGIATKYVHGEATFSSGNTYGHVWAQILVDKVWYVADTIGTKNSLSVINNWNINTHKIYGYYSSINF